MSNFTTRRQFRKRVPTKPEIYPGKLGDGYGNVEVSGMTNYVYCRIGDRVERVYNDTVPAIDDLAVDVGRDINDPLKFQVLGTRSYQPGGGGGTIQVGYAPAKRYQIFAPGGGQDPLWVEGRQIMPLRLGPYSGMSIQVHDGFIYPTAGVKYIPWQSSDMTAHIPAGAGNAALVLITFNTSGTLVATKGTEFTLADKTTAALMLAMVPAIPASTAYVCGAVRVYNTQTAVAEGPSNTDIIDLRFTGVNVAASTVSNHASTHISTGSDPVAAAVAGGASGLLTGADKTKLDGITALATPLTVEEVDGAPSVTPVTKIKFPNGSVTDDTGGTVTIATLSNPMTTAGDVIYGGASGTPTRLAIGTAAQVFKVNAGATAPEWGGLTAAQVSAVPSDGWIAGTATWTYASASTFTISGDLTATYTKGLRLRFKQGAGYKYAVVESSAYGAPNTTVTIIVNTDYTVANAAITDNYYSQFGAPPGWPGWFNYTATYAGFSADPTGTSRYSINGNICTVSHFESASGTSNATTFTVSAPTAAGASAIAMIAAAGYVMDNGAVAIGSLRVNASGTVINVYKGSLGAFTNSGDKRASFTCVYEI